MNETTVQPHGLGQPVPRVGVVIVTWNKKSFVLNLLDDLAARPYPNWSVLVVDNCSSDGTAEALADRHPWVRVIRTPSNLGGSGGFNTGLRAMLDADGFDYVWLLDNDVSLEPGALEVLVETLESRPDAGVAGSHMVQMDDDITTNEIGGDVDLERGRLLLRQHGSYARMHGAEVYEVDYVAACSLLVRYSVLKEVGIWDDFFIHYDDVDWCLRIRTAGHRILACAASRIRHMSARTKPVTWMLYYDIRNILYLQTKHLIFRPLRCLYFVLLLLYYGVRDELGGKGYYTRLVERALRDWLSGTIGRSDRLLPLPLAPLDEARARVLGAKPGHILVLEPTRRPVFSETELAQARAAGTRIEALCSELDSRATALPAGAPRIRLSPRPLVMALQLLKRALVRPRADYLVLDIDQPCGLAGLCARRIVLVVDDRCVEVPGGPRRALAALQWPIRWVPLVCRLAAFALRRV